MSFISGTGEFFSLPAGGALTPEARLGTLSAHVYGIFIYLCIYSFIYSCIHVCLSLLFSEQ